MDVQMPVMDGLEATRAIRASEKLKSLPVIATTANAMSTDVENCRQAGMDAHIAKPLDEKDIILKIHSVLKTKLPR